MDKSSWQITMGVLGGALTVLTVSAANAEASSHKVVSGDSLWTISMRYGCEVGALKSANRLEGNLIRPNDELVLPRSCTKRPSSSKPRTLERDPENPSTTPPARVADPTLPAVTTEIAPVERGKIRSAIVRYKVARGDTLIGLARRYGTSVGAIQGQNGLPTSLIMIDQVLAIPAHSQTAIGSDRVLEMLPVRTLVGQSIGRASGGALSNPTLLPQEPTYHRRRPNLAYGTLHMVEQIRQVTRLVKGRHPAVHKLAVGDLSAAAGGKIRRHVSHQSGRDVDLGFYFTRKPKGYPETFITATASNLDFAATWSMLKAFADTADDAGGVHMMFLNYDVQKLIYDWARERGVAKSVLSWMFQYPRGKYVRSGLIRHEPGHSGHVHVRFKCAPKDKSCY